MNVKRNSIELFKAAEQWSDFIFKEKLKIAYNKGFLNQDGWNQVGNFLRKYEWDNILNEPIGMTADGLASIIIYLDNEFKSDVNYNVHAIIDGLDGDQIPYIGEISELTVLSNGRLGVIMTAPSQFPNSTFSSEYNVTIDFDIVGDNDIAYSASTDVKIIRPGALLLHGLWGNADTFDNLEKYLINSGSYKDYQVYNGVYKSNAESFDKNTFINNVVKNGLTTLYYKLATNGIVSARYDLIGHSMGGILSRLYAQEINKNGVNRIITLDTPHSGSQLTYLREPIIKAISSILGKLTGVPATMVVLEFYLDFLTSNKYGVWAALEDLNPNSDAIAFLNGDHMINAKGVPVHAICSEITDPILDIDTSSAQELSRPVDVIIALFSIYQHIVNKTGKAILDFLYAGPNDGVVSVVSQRGGLNDKYVTIEYDNYAGFFGVDTKTHHINTNKWDFTFKNISALLSLPRNSDYFSKEGFNPTDLSFKTMHRQSGDYVKLKPAESENTFIKIDVKNNGNEVIVTLDPSDDVSKNSVLALLNNEQALVGINNRTYRFEIPNSYEGQLVFYTIGTTENGEIVADKDSVYIEKTALLNDIRINSDRTLIMTVGQKLTLDGTASYNTGAIEKIAIPLFAEPDGIIQIDGSTIVAKKTGVTNLIASIDNLTDEIKVIVLPYFDELDINHDGCIDVGDVNLILSSILSSSSDLSLDVNGDNEINVGDVNVILDAILRN